MGTTQSTTFVHLAASLDRSEVAIAGTTWFLAQSFGSLIGASCATALMNSVLGSTLDHALDYLKEKDVVCHLALCIATMSPAVNLLSC
jgi:hypothetical protein